MPSSFASRFSYAVVLIGDETSFQHPESSRNHLDFLKATSNEWAVNELASYDSVREWIEEDIGTIQGHRRSSKRGQLMFRKKLHGRYIQIFRALDYFNYFYMLSIAVMLGYKGKEEKPAFSYSSAGFQLVVI